MVTVNEIQKIIYSYLTDKNLDSFSEKFAVMFYDIEKTGDEAAVQFSYEIESMLAAITAGHLDEAAFHDVMQCSVPSNYSIVEPVLFGAALPISQEAGTSQVLIVRGHIVLAGGFGLGVDPHSPSHRYPPRNMASSRDTYPMTTLLSTWTTPITYTWRDGFSCTTVTGCETPPGTESVE